MVAPYIISIYLVALINRSHKFKFSFRRKVPKDTKIRKLLTLEYPTWRASKRNDSNLYQNVVYSTQRVNEGARTFAKINQIIISDFRNGEC